VAVRFEWDGKNLLRVEHDGAYFSAQDLAALLSGGSSKEFEAVETTGRFGTGFLSTHVLGYQVQVNGLLMVDESLEEFSLLVNREGDESAIVENIDLCDRALKSARAVLDPARRATAIFEYRVDNPSAVEAGLEALAEALPYLYGTCDRLGSVTIRTPSGKTVFEPGQARAESSWTRRSVFVAAGDRSVTREVLCFPAADNLPGALLVLVEEDAGELRVLVPPGTLPRLFVRFPVRGSEALPIPGVANGQFAVADERNAVHDNDTNRQLFKGILTRIPDAARVAATGAWRNSHELARVGPISGDATIGLAEVAWWNAELGETALALAELPIIQSGASLLPASSPDGSSYTIDFVVPGISRKSAEGLGHADVWRLASRVTTLCPPVASLSDTWSGIAVGWAALGVDLQLLGLDEIGAHVREAAETLVDLPVEGPAEEWVASLVELVSCAQTATKSQLPTLLDRLLPSQDGRLRECRHLDRDEGVSEQVKDIGARLDIDFRGELLAKGVAAAAERLGLKSVERCLAELIPKAVSNDDAIERCLHRLDTELPTGKAPREESADLLHVSRDLLKYLLSSALASTAPFVRRCPLGCTDGSIVRVAAGTHVLAPVVAWPVEAQPFADVYPPQRVLSGEYADAEILAKLVAAGMALAEPLVVEQVAELRGPRLKPLVHPEDLGEGLVVSGASMMQLADLPTQVMQRCQQDENRAKLLLGMILTYAARRDRGWQSWGTLAGRRDGASVQVRGTTSLWLADVLSKAWIPVPAPDGTTQVMAAVQSTLDRLLDPAWLKGNGEAVLLLSTHFGFSELQLRLAAVVSDPAARRQVEDGLARIVELVGGAPSEYAKVAQAIEQERQKAEEVAQNRVLGLAVQEAVAQALVSMGLSVELVDRGFDYAVSAGAGDSAADTSHRFGVGKYLVEVKTTTSGEVRLTPTQARTASESPEAFVLCVVDLREVGPNPPDGGWTAEAVSPHVVLVPSVATAIEEPWDLVQEAKDCEITVRNDESIRYGVPVATWEKGVSIAAWVETLRQTKAVGTPAVG